VRGGRGVGAAAERDEHAGASAAGAGLRGRTLRRTCATTWIFTWRIRRSGAAGAYFFRGGFVVGNKNTVPGTLLDACKQAGITVASCNLGWVLRGNDRLGCSI